MTRTLGRVGWGVAAVLAAGWLAGGLAAEKGAGRPDWAVPHGEEFWRQPGSGSDVVAGPDAGDVVERVTHALRPAGPGRWEAASEAYTLRVDSDGVRFLPHRPGAGDTARPEPAVSARVQTLSVRAGDSELLGPGRESSARAIEGNTVQARLDPAGRVVEHLEARGAGVEVSWVLAERPAAAGDLALEWALEGLSPLPGKPGHFADASGTARVRVGEAWAVDQSRRRWPVAMTQAGGRMRLGVSESVLDQAVYPLAIDPVISSEFGVDQPVYTNAAGFQARPAASWNGTCFFAVWMDSREGATNLWGARVSTNGLVLDPGGLALATNPATGKADPAVGWGGTNWFVAWTETVDGTNDIRGARVDGAGLVLDPTGLVVCAEGAAQQAPAVGWGVTNWLVAWEDFRAGAGDPNIYGMRVTPDGAMLDGTGLAICAAAERQQNPHVEWGGTNWLVVWQYYNSGYQVYGGRVTQDGQALDGDGFGVDIAGGTGAAHCPWASWGQTNWLVAWVDGRNDSANADIYAKRVGEAGSVLGGVITVCNASGPQTNASVAWGQTNWLVVWGDFRAGAGSPEVYAGRVDEAANVLDGNGFVLAAAAGTRTEPVISRGDDTWLVAWSDVRGGRESVYGARVAWETNALDGSGRLLATAANGQSAPAAAWGQTNWLVVWSDSRSGSEDIYGARVDAATNLLDPAGIAICTVSNAQNQVAARWGGTNWLVVWSDQRGAQAAIYGARVSAAGQVADPGGQALGPAAGGQFVPAADWGSTNWLVAWEDYRGGSPRVYGARVTGGLGVLDAGGKALCAQANDQMNPDVAWGRTNWLVAWEDYRAGALDSGIYATRLSPAAGILDGTGVALCTAADLQTRPAVSWGHTNWLAAWQDFRSGTDFDVYGGRVAAGGAALDGQGVALCSVSNDQASVAVSWNQTNWFAAWQDQRHTGLGPAVYGGRVDAGAAVLDADGVALAGPGGGDRIPSVRFGAGGRALAVWSQLLAAPFSAERVRGVFWEEPYVLANLGILGTNGALLASGAAAGVAAGTDFGSLHLDDTAVTHTFAVTNPGGLYLDIADVALSGAGAARFQVGAIPDTLPAGGAAAFEVTFDPSVTGVHTAVVTLANSSATTPYILNLRGTSSKRSQTIVFPALSNQAATGRVGLAATASSGLAVTFAVVSGPGQLAGGTNLTFTNSGVVKVAAAQAGSAIYLAAPTVTNSLTVSKAGQTIAFPAVPSQAATGRVGLAATASSGLAVTFAVVSGPGRLAGGTNLTFTNSGVVKVAASQPGSAIYLAAPTVTNSLTVSKAGQTIAFAALSDQQVTNRVGLAATASSGLAVSFAVVSGPGQLAGGTNLSFTATGLVSVAASQAGSDLYAAAPDVIRSFHVTRSGGGGAHPGDYSGDGRSDLAVFDTNTGFWYIRTLAGEVVAWAVPWGWPGAWPVAGDYDGDGRYDLAVFDTTTGAWYISSLDGAVLAWAAAWGWPGAWPVSGDYNGDATSDLAVFDTNTGAWYALALPSSPIAWAVAWGWPGAWPVSGDYNGDATSDLAVFDTNTGAWYALALPDQPLVWAAAWGWPGAYPVSGDYNGDAVSDLAVFDTNTGAWYAQSVAGAVLVWAESWGWPGARPVSGDYDGDALSDLAVFDTNTGFWYIRTVSGTVLAWAEPWGWPGAWPLSSSAW